MIREREERRLQLQEKLEELFSEKVAKLEDGSPAILFQPPENVKLKYPCIIYNYESDYFRHANDHGYYLKAQYEITVIDRDPDTTIWYEIVSSFSYCKHNRRFVTDNLYHDVIGLYY